MSNYTPLLCKDCSEEIFANVNMVMLKDNLWLSVADKLKDALCDCCIEKRMGRKITLDDLKPSTMGVTVDGIDMIPCNAWRFEGQKSILKEAKKLSADVKGIYKDIVKDNIEQFLFELAQQANSNEISRGGAEAIAGKRLVELAVKYYPFAKVK